MDNKNNKGFNVTAIIVSSILAVAAIVVALILAPKVVNIGYISEDIVMQSAKDGYVFRTREHKETKMPTIPATSSTARETRVDSTTTRSTEAQATTARQETTAQESRPMVEDTTPAYAQTTTAVAQTTPVVKASENPMVHEMYGEIPNPSIAHEKKGSYKYLEYVLYYDTDFFALPGNNGYLHLSGEPYVDWGSIDLDVAMYIYDNWVNLKDTLNSLGSYTKAGESCHKITYRDDFFFEDGKEFIYSYSLEVVTVMDCFYIIGKPYWGCNSIDDENIYFILDYSYFEGKIPDGTTYWGDLLARQGEQLYGYLTKGSYKAIKVGDYTLVLVGAHYE